MTLHPTHLFFHTYFIGSYIITEHFELDEDLEYISMMQMAIYFGLVNLYADR